MALSMIMEVLAIPTDLVMRVLEAIQEEVDREMLNTIDSVREKMFEIQLMNDLHKITEKEYSETMKLLENKLDKLEERP